MNEPNEDLERIRLVRDVWSETRPALDELITAYADYRTRFSGLPDADERAYHALVMYISVGLEMSRYTDQDILAVVAFAARRLWHHQPRLAATLN